MTDPKNVLACKLKKACLQPPVKGLAGSQWIIPRAGICNPELFYHANVSDKISLCCQTKRYNLYDKLVKETLELSLRVSTFNNDIFY